MAKKAKTSGKSGKTPSAGPRPRAAGHSLHGHRYNWRPDIPDQRDFLFSQKVAPRVQLPTSVDLRSHCSPVFDQGKIGSCTGNALAGGLEFLEIQELKAKGKLDAEIFVPGKFAHISRLFIYYNERALEGHASEDSGGMLRDGVKSLVQSGACRETVWKYLPSQALKRPSPKAYEEAKNHKISSYLRLSTMGEMKQCLADGFPFAFGFTVYESFESDDVARTGIMPLPAPGEQTLGGHAVLAVGYNDATSMLIVRNSWGTAWGDKGYFLMPYAYIEKKHLAADFWTLRK